MDLEAGCLCPVELMSLFWSEGYREFSVTQDGHPLPLFRPWTDWQDPATLGREGSLLSLRGHTRNCAWSHVGAPRPSFRSARLTVAAPPPATFSPSGDAGRGQHLQPPAAGPECEGASE